MVFKGNLCITISMHKIMKIECGLRDREVVHLVSRIKMIH